MPTRRKLPEFVVGDLVYDIGNLNPYGFPYTDKNPRRVGIVAKIVSHGAKAYAVYWLKEGIVSEHLANHLELVYNV
tara:strand:+ start:107 stop:334 length:228 start_codon:yes stop_codon:yes gene_type:complete